MSKFCWINSFDWIFGLAVPISSGADFSSVNFEQSLGQTAYYLAQAGLTGYLATVANLKEDVSEWRCGGAPLPVSQVLY